MAERGVIEWVVPKLRQAEQHLNALVDGICAWLDSQADTPNSPTNEDHHRRRCGDRGQPAFEASEGRLAALAGRLADA